MICKNCHEEIPDGTKFCPNCGTKIETMEAEPTAFVPDGAEAVQDVQTEPGVQPEMQQPEAEQPQITQPEPVYQSESSYQSDAGAQNYQNQNEGYYQNGQGYQNGQYYQDPQGYQNPNYQNNYTYQAPDQRNQINWVPYLILSIVSTMCCCLPFGIAAIVFSARINSAQTAGNIQEAENAAKQAKIWIIVAFAVGVVVQGFNFFINILGAMGGYYY